MGKLAPSTEQFQHFVENVKESFWGDLQGATRQAWRKFLDAESLRERDRYLGAGWYERTGGLERDYRNGFYERDYTTVFGTLRLRIARTRKRNFLPKGLSRFQRRADEVMLLVREAFLRGIGTRQVGRVIAILTGEPISAQTVSNLTRGLNAAVEGFRRAKLRDEWVYLFLDGVNLKVRRAFGRQRVQMLVAYGVRADGSRQLLGFVRSQGESQAAWEGLLNNLQGRGLVGDKLRMIITDGCAGLAAAIQTVYPSAKHQRCWVHKMRNILEHVRKRDYAAVKAGAQAIYGADNKAKAGAAARRFAWSWRYAYPSMVKQMEKDLPELLTFFDFPRHLWKKLRTTNAIERIFVEVRRRTRPMVVFVNTESVDRIVFSIFNRFNEEWRNRTLRLFTQAA